MDVRLRRELGQTAVVVAGAAALGAAVAVVTAPADHPMYLATLLVQGAVDGSLMAAFASAWALGSARPAVHRRLRQQRFVVAALLNAVVYGLLLLAGRAAGHALVGANGPELAWLAGTRRFFRPSTLVPAVLVSFGATTAASFLLQVNRLVGQDVLRAFVTGRYHRPRREERVFLFLDLVGSTALAEQLGDVAFLDLVDRFFGDVTEAVVATGGTIYKYVGDEVIVTWPADEGLARGRAVDCFLQARAAVDASAASYREQFGVVPSFRGGLHGGDVVAGEVGDVKREIAWLGDVVNTTARLMEHAKHAGEPLVVSGWVAERTTPPPGWRFRGIGTIQPRGRVGAMDVHAVEADVPERVSA